MKIQTTLAVSAGWWAAGSLFVVACAAAPPPTRESLAARYGLTADEESQCHGAATEAARYDDMSSGGYTLFERNPPGPLSYKREIEHSIMGRCVATVREARELTLSEDLRLGLVSIGCLSMRRQEQLAAQRKSEDLRRQGGELVTRKVNPVSEDRYQDLFRYSSSRLNNRFGRYSCGSVETIDVSECMLATLEDTEKPTSCEIPYVAAAIQAFRSDVAEHLPAAQ